MSSSNNSVTQVDRPGCVTAYAILLWLGGGLVAFSALSSISLGLSGGTAVGVGLFALVLLAGGLGLWRMHPWGWWFVVIVHSFSVIISALALLGSLFSFTDFDSGLIFRAIVYSGVSGGILVWFLDNRPLFNNPTTPHASTETDNILDGTPPES